MNYEEAIQHIKEGKCVYRRQWIDTNDSKSMYKRLKLKPRQWQLKQYITDDDLTQDPFPIRDFLQLKREDSIDLYFDENNCFPNWVPSRKITDEEIKKYPLQMQEELRQNESKNIPDIEATDWEIWEDEN